MKLRLIVLLSVALGLVSGAFLYSLLSVKQHQKEVAAARAQGRADAEKAMADELAALKPVVLKTVANAETKADGDLLRQLPEIKAIDGLLMLPRPIKFVMAECREPNAFYMAERAEVVMCYETMKVLLDRGQQLAKDQELGDAYAQKYLTANLRFILLHETGHALIDLLDIPITGREEDAVDQLATTLMQRFAGMNESSRQVSENLRMASNWFLARSTGAYNLDAYADEHALGEQRYFNLQCLVYGSNPARYIGIVTEGDLPEARAKTCPAEARRVDKAWLRLLLPHVAPKYEMTEEKANRLFEQRERERNRNAELPYVR